MPYPSTYHVNPIVPAFSLAAPLTYSSATGFNVDCTSAITHRHKGRTVCHSVEGVERRGTHLTGGIWGGAVSEGCAMQVYTIHTQDWGGGARFAWSPEKPPCSPNTVGFGLESHMQFLLFFLGGWLMSKRGPVPVYVNTCVPCESRIFALLTCKILFLEAKLSQKRNLLPQTPSSPSSCPWTQTRPA